MDHIEIVLPDMKRAAGRVARKWPEVTNQEDLFQDLVIHFLDRPGSLEALALLPSDKRLARLVAIGHERASANRDDLEVFSGQFTYSVDEVRKLAERGAVMESVQDYDAPSLDMQQAMTVLKRRNRDYWSALIEKYVNGISPERNSAAAKVLERGLESLTTLMNRASTARKYEFTNGGRYRNNRSALNGSDRDYEGAGRYDD
jgi:hypothetical protein